MRGSVLRWRYWKIGSDFNGWNSHVECSWITLIIGHKLLLKKKRDPLRSATWIWMHSNLHLGNPAIEDFFWCSCSPPCINCFETFNPLQCILTLFDREKSFKNHEHNFSTTQTNRYVFAVMYFKIEKSKNQTYWYDHAVMYWIGYFEAQVKESKDFLATPTTH